MRRKNDIICIGIPSLAMSENEYTDFILHIEKSVLASLKGMGMLTEKQHRLCADEEDKII